VFVRAFATVLSRGTARYLLSRLCHRIELWNRQDKIQHGSIWTHQQIKEVWRPVKRCIYNMHQWNAPLYRAPLTS